MTEDDIDKKIVTLERLAEQGKGHTEEFNRILSILNTTPRSLITAKQREKITEISVSVWDAKLDNEEQTK